MKGQPKEWEKIFANHIQIKGKHPKYMLKTHMNSRAK